MEIPFNLHNLRRHLAQLQLARRVLPEDVTARQTLLEASVHEVAAERFKHEDAIYKQLGLGAGLNERNLQAWMWDWHQALESRLTTAIKDIEMAEENPKWPIGRKCSSVLITIIHHLSHSAPKLHSPRTIAVSCES